jgi:hypothetical protein
LHIKSRGNCRSLLVSPDLTCVRPRPVKEPERSKRLKPVSGRRDPFNTRTKVSIPELKKTRNFSRVFHQSSVGHLSAFEDRRWGIGAIVVRHRVNSNKVCKWAGGLSVTVFVHGLSFGGMGVHSYACVPSFCSRRLLGIFKTCCKSFLADIC